MPRYKGVKVKDKGVGAYKSSNVYMHFMDEEGSASFKEWWLSIGERHFAHWLGRDEQDKYDSQREHIKES